ncbi:unnamed protein product [Hydatigera taeniaeformis]|uniref:Ionotropic glutamate receptor C-terminal domain-containing protein n=1 Tax=Hydatigena taeniaeformis TaxID=6205 RepID=A0A3P7FIM2_HYDTA|nr:unnamed protein product [Hydatigera taeniaeformis]
MQVSLSNIIGIFKSALFLTHLQVDISTQEVFKRFSDAGADLAVVSPVLCCADSAPVEASLKALDQLSIKYVADSVIQLDGKLVPFTSQNFLQLIQTLSTGFYDHRTGQLTLLPNIYNRTVIKLLAFQDATFLPSFENREFSMAMQMINEIFPSKTRYEIEVVPVAYNKGVVIQTTVEDYLSRSDVTMAMSAFPLPLDTSMKVRHTGAVLYDGVVMLKSRKTSKLTLFHIFDSLSGFIWLCVFASLIFVAIIFFIIKVVNDHQCRSMGIVSEDGDIPLFKRFLTVIFRNFSAVLLAKMRGEFEWPGIKHKFFNLDDLNAPPSEHTLIAMRVISFHHMGIVSSAIKHCKLSRSVGNDGGAACYKSLATLSFCVKMLVKPKLTSLRVLYQSYWMASILIVATYAASLAEQRFVQRDTTVPFNSLNGLLKNTANYRWIFLRNSSVIWMMQVSVTASSYPPILTVFLSDRHYLKPALVV